MGTRAGQMSTEHANPLFFPYGPSGLYSTNFKSLWLLGHAPATEVRACKGSRGRRAGGEDPCTRKGSAQDKHSQKGLG